MAASWSDSLENSILNYVFGATAYTNPATLYVGLSTANPGDDFAGLAEPVIGTGAYARVAIDNNKTTWHVSTAGTLHNEIAITFPTATLSWGVITYYHIADRALLANSVYLCYCQLTNSKTVDPGDTCSFAIGDLVISLD
jgi:hypothetical protein